MRRGWRRELKVNSKRALEVFAGIDRTHKIWVLKGLVHVRKLPVFSFLRLVRVN